MTHRDHLHINVNHCTKFAANRVKCSPVAQFWGRPTYRHVQVRVICPSFFKGEIKSQIHFMIALSKIDKSLTLIFLLNKHALIFHLLNQAQKQISLGKMTSPNKHQ